MVLEDVVRDADLSVGVASVSVGLGRPRRVVGMATATVFPV